MSRLTLAVIAIFSVSVTDVICDSCPEPTDASLKCSKVAELASEGNCYKEWAVKKCQKDGKHDESIVIDDNEVTKYKTCLKTHLEPCLQNDVLKNFYTEMFNKFDLKNACKESVEKDIEKYVMDQIEKNHEMLEKEGDKHCSQIKNAMTEVKKCIGL